MSDSFCQLKCDFEWSKRCKMWFQWNANAVCIVMGELCKCKWNAQDSAVLCPLLQQSSLIHNNPDFIVLHRWSNEMNRMWKRSPWQQESLFEKLVVWRLRPGLINASQSQESLHYETLYVHEMANWIIIDNVDKLVEKPGMWELETGAFKGLWPKGHVEVTRSNQWQQSILALGERPRKCAFSWIVTSEPKMLMFYPSKITCTVANS